MSEALDGQTSSKLIADFQKWSGVIVVVVAVGVLVGGTFIDIFFTAIGA
jgi:hypothetical protein